MTEPLTHALRADAQDNRDRILDAARAVFATEGLNVPMREIARRAGVGPATLYRRFPTKDALLVELVRQRFLEFAVIAAEVERTVDAADGLETVMRRQAENSKNDAAFQFAIMNLDSYH